MSEKLYKCGYAHCTHPNDKSTASLMEKIGKRYFHKKCAYIKDMIQVATKYYYDYVDDKSEYKIVVGVLNNIIFKKGYSVDLVIFMMKYIVAHGCRIRSPYTLHYVIKNPRLHTEYNDDCKREKVCESFEYRQRNSSRSEGETRG